MEPRSAIVVLIATAAAAVVLALPALLGWVGGYELIGGVCALSALVWAAASVAIRVHARHTHPRSS